MKRLAITELEVKTLRKIAAKDPTEARWRIQHEANVQKAWTDDRTAFLLIEVLGPPVKPTTTKGKGEVVIAHGNPGQRIVGSKIG